MKCDKCQQGVYHDSAGNNYICQYCKGTGVTPRNQCGACDGIGKVRRVDPMDNSYYRAPCLICGGTGVTASLDRGKEECVACKDTGVIKGDKMMHDCPCRSYTIGGTTYDRATGEPIAMHVTPIEDKPRHYTVARCPTCDTTMHTVVDHNMKMVGAPYCPTCVPDREGRLIRAAGDVMRAQRLKGIAKYNSTLEDQNGYTVGGMIDMVAEELADGSVYVQKVREQYHALLDELEKAVNEPVNTHQQRLVEIAQIIKRERGNV